MNHVNSLTEQTKVVKAQDKLNLARSKGEYAPRWTRKPASEILAKQVVEERSLEDKMMWA